MERNEIFKTLIEKGANVINDVTVNSVTITENKTYTNVSLGIDKTIKQFITKDNGVTFQEEDVNVAFATTFNLRAIMGSNPDLAFLGSHIVKHPEALETILPNAKINVVQELIKAGTEYINPFTTKSEPEIKVWDHDVWVTYIKDITLGEDGQKQVNQLKTFKLLGISPAAIFESIVGNMGL